MTDHSALIKRPCAATDQADLRDRIMNPNVAKSEAEWWASREIERLESILRDLMEWRDISEHSGHAPVMVSTKPSNPNCLFSEPVSAFVDATGVCRCLGSVGGMAPLSRKPTHFRPLPSAPNQAKEAGE